jgi:3' exoribonuclease, RNase T-like
MKIFYDSEFFEDGKTIDLISIGMVAQDGREYYAVSSEFDLRGLQTNPEFAETHNWLSDNVFPSLPFIVGLEILDDRHPDVKNRTMIMEEVSEFILNTADAQLWAWYGAYDHVVLAQLFGSMARMPKHIPKWTNDLRQEVQRLGNPRLPDQAHGEHNALEDAKWLKHRYEWLYKYAVGNQFERHNLKEYYGVIKDCTCSFCHYHQW